MARFPVLTSHQASAVFPWAGQLVRRLETAFRSSNSGSFTLDLSSATTTVTDVASRPGGKVLITPETTEAATELTSTFIAASDVEQGKFTVTHASNATADRTFSYVLFEPLRGVR